MSKKPTAAQLAAAAEPARTSLFELLSRPYEAVCTNVQDQFYETNGGPVEACNLSLTLRGITPWDLKGSRLLHSCFREKQEAIQESIDAAIAEAEQDPLALAIARYNASFELVPLKRGERSDEDASHKVTVHVTAAQQPLIERIEDEGAEFYPVSGIALKYLRATDQQPKHTPMVELDIIVKGLSYTDLGLGWRLSRFEVEFPGKSQAECDSDADLKAQRGRKKKSEAGDLLEDEDEGEDSGDFVSFADLSPEGLDDLPLGKLYVQWEGDTSATAIEKRSAGGTCWLAPDGHLKTSEILMDEFGDRLISGFVPNDAEAELPEWIKPVAWTQDGAGRS